MMKDGCNCFGNAIKETTTVATLREFVAITAAVAPHSLVRAIKLQTPTQAEDPYSNMVHHGKSEGNSVVSTVLRITVVKT